MTDDRKSPENPKLPDTTDAHPDDPQWLDTMDLDVLLVRRYDTDDIMVGRQYFVIMHDDTEDGQFMVSSVARPPEPESI